MRRPAAVAAVLLLGLGLLAGLVPLSWHGVGCGVGWHATSAAYGADIARTLGGAPDDGLQGLQPYGDGCGSRRNVARGAALVLLLAGGLAGAVAAASAGPRRQDPGQP